MFSHCLSNSLQQKSNATVKAPFESILCDLGTQMSFEIFLNYIANMADPSVQSKVSKIATLKLRIEQKIKWISQTFDNTSTPALTIDLVEYNVTVMFNQNHTIFNPLDKQAKHTQHTNLITLYKSLPPERRACRDMKTSKSGKLQILLILL